MTIFNRYGITVYSSSGYTHPWDGKFNGKNVPTGTYYYLISPGSGQRTFSGNVTLIR